MERVGVFQLRLAGVDRQGRGSAAGRPRRAGQTVAASELGNENDVDHPPGGGGAIGRPRLLRQDFEPGQGVWREAEEVPRIDHPTTVDNNQGRLRKAQVFADAIDDLADVVGAEVVDLFGSQLAFRRQPGGAPPPDDFDLFQLGRDSRIGVLGEGGQGDDGQAGQHMRSPRSAELQYGRHRSGAACARVRHAGTVKKAGRRRRPAKALQVQRARLAPGTKGFAGRECGWSR